VAGHRFGHVRLTGMEFTRGSLETAGFVGWTPLTQVRSSGCPAAGGVYVITYAPSGEPRFAAASCGGWFKGRDPSVALSVLEANWVDGAEVVYIGKASRLRRRLTQYADFGAGKPVGHWGGRLIWQLADVAGLQVAWRETPGEAPEAVEARMLSAFRAAYGKAPFANDPRRLGR
jgi:hypothetical protein